MVPESLALPGLFPNAALWPWRAVLAAALAALAWALACRRLLRWPEAAPAAAAVGLLIGWWVTLGLLTASPRQLLERLPVLALAAVLAGALVPALAGRGAGWRQRLGPLWAWAAALACGWWMAGAPQVGADLQRAGPALLGLALAAGLLRPRLSATPAAAAAGFAALAAGFWAAAAPGPYVPLALAGCVAALAALAVGAGGGMALGLPMALTQVSLAAVPVLARGLLADWMAAAAPVSALVLGPVLAARLPRRVGPWLGWALAAAPAVLAAVAATRFP
jgi:hypothetical protein